MRAIYIAVMLGVAMMTSIVLASPQKESVDVVFQKLVDSAQKEDKEGAMALIEKLGSFENAVAFLAERINSDVELEAGLAFSVLQMMKDRREEVLPVIWAATRHADVKIRGAAAMSLCDLDKSEKTVDRLIELLEDDGSVVQWKAAYCLKRIGPGAEKAIPALAKAIGDPNEDVHSEAMIALGAIHARHETSVPALIQGLDIFTLHAAIALRSFGRDAAPAVPALLESLKHCMELKSAWTAREIAMTLAVTGDPRSKEALPAIERLLAEESAINTREELTNTIKTIQAFE